MSSRGNHATERPRRTDTLRDRSLKWDVCNDPYGFVDYVDYTTFKSDLPEFNGNSSNPEVFLDWVSEIENAFNRKDVEDAVRVEITVSRLKSLALLWWNDLQNYREQEGFPEITTWSEMHCEMHRKFVPGVYKRDACIRLLKWKQQEGMSVAEYTEVFHKLCYRAEIKDSEEQKVCRYIVGFRDELQYGLLMHEVIKRMDEAVETAYMIENVWRSTVKAGIDYWELRRKHAENNPRRVPMLCLEMLRVKTKYH